MAEVQAAQCRVQEGESLLRSLRTEVLEGQLRLREADEHIGFIRDFLQKQKLYQLTQAPMVSAEGAESPPSPSTSVGSQSPSPTSDEHWDDSSSKKPQAANERSTGRSEEEGQEPLGCNAAGGSELQGACPG